MVILDNLIDNILTKLKSNETNNEKEIEYYNEIIQKMESNIKSQNFVTSKLDNGEEKIFKADKMQITLTTIQTEKNKINDINNTITQLDLTNCENDLRNHYQLSADSILYLEKMDIEQPDLDISKIEYRIYTRLNGKNLVRLNISECRNSQIFISMPMELKGNIDKYNSSSDYYNSKCYTSTSESDTDISLADRKNELINGNDIVCQNGCFLAYYNSSIKYGKCSCEAKEASSDFKNMNINRNEIFENSGSSNTRTSTNFDITACNVLNSPENIKSNTGFYLLLIILAIFIIVFIVFCSKGYNLLRNKMDEVIYKKFKDKNHKIH